MKCCAGESEITDLETLVNLARGSRYSLLWWPGPRAETFVSRAQGKPITRLHEVVRENSVQRPSGLGPN